jgi:glycosyltransferase involved in cell wall biosynthesis
VPPQLPKRPVKVLVLDQCKGVWGAQRYLLRLAPLIREMNIELVLGGSRDLELHDAWRASGLDAVDLDLPIERNLRRDGRPTVRGILEEARKGFGAAGRIARASRAGDYDVIWANSHWTHVDATVAGNLCRRPVVLHLHEEAMPGLGQRLRSTAVRLADRTVAVSEGVASGLALSARKRATVIPNGVDTDRWSPASDNDRGELDCVRASFGVGASDVMVLAATRIDPTKRIEDLIAAIRRADDPRIRLVVAGKTSGYPDYERDVRAKARILPEGRITFCGHRDDMTTLFRASDIVLHAGILEGMPLGLLEAQSCGKPVVAYDVAGVPEAVRDGVTGFLAPPRDTVTLSRALRSLTEDRALRATFGANARAHVLAHHRIETQAQRNAAVLAEICCGAEAMAE